MKARSLRKKISVKYAEGIVKTDDRDQVVKFPLLTSGDWGEFKDKTGIDIWSLLLSLGADSAKVAEMDEAELDEHRRETSINLLKTIDPKSQILMIYLSLRRDDEEVTMDDVDYVVSYGMDQAEYVKIVSFLIYGVNSEQAKELQEDGESKNEPKAAKTKSGTTKEDK